MTFSIYQASVPVYPTARSPIGNSRQGRRPRYPAQDRPCRAHSSPPLPGHAATGASGHIACSHAMRGASRLSGAEPTTVEDKANSFDDLKARIAMTVEFLKGVDAKKMEGMKIATSLTPTEIGK